MKKLFSILILLLIPNVYAQTCNIKCPSESLNIIEGETILNKITGINFVSKKIIELAIQNNLIDETIIDNAVQKNIDLKYRYGIIRQDIV